MCQPSLTGGQSTRRLTTSCGSGGRRVGGSMAGFLGQDTEPLIVAWEKLQKTYVKLEYKVHTVTFSHLGDKTHNHTCK